MPLPWDSDRPLDAARVESVVSAQFPDLAPARAEFLDQGWDSDAYLVNDAWVFRFPKRRGIEASHAVERALLPRLAPRLSIPVPNPSRFGRPCDAFPYRFVGHRRIEGTPAWHVPAERVDADAAARDLAAMLSRVHAFPVEEARALGLPEPPLEARLVDPPARLAPLWPRIAPALGDDLARRAAEFLGAPPPPPHPAPRRVCHTDLRDGHVLLTADGRRIAGVIDWGDACLFDPAVDFAGPFAWRGEAFVRRMLDLYEGDVDPGLLERARARCVFVSLYCVWHGVLAPREDFLASGLRGLRHALP